VALGKVTLIDESRWPSTERQGQYLQMSSYQEYHVCYARVARLWGQEAATGLGVKADDACCSGYLWY
jgi:hypothetical protein